MIALPVLIQATTGALLVFEPEIDAWFNGDRFLVEPSGTPLGLQQQFDAFVAAEPEMEEHVYILRLPASEREATVLLAKAYNEIGPRRGVRFFLNPYDGSVSEGQPYHTTTMGKIYNLHRTLWLPRWGRWITSTSALLTATLALSGLILYFFGSRARALTSGWLAVHRRVGVGAAPVVALIALNGAAVTYLFVVIPLLYFVTGTEMPREMREARSTRVEEDAASPRKPLEAIIAEAREPYPDAEPRVLLQPSRANTAITVVLRKPHEPRKEGGTMVVMHPQTGEALGVTDFTDGALGHQAVYWLIHLHKGTWGGYLWGEPGRIATRTTWLLAATTASLLALTGAVAWWRRQPVE